MRVLLKCVILIREKKKPGWGVDGGGGERGDHRTDSSQHKNDLVYIMNRKEIKDVVIL